MTDTNTNKIAANASATPAMGIGEVKDSYLLTVNVAYYQAAGTSGTVTVSQANSLFKQDLASWLSSNAYKVEDAEIIQEFPLIGLLVIFCSDTIARSLKNLDGVLDIELEQQVSIKPA
jgi:hypothetical protein